MDRFISCLSFVWNKANDGQPFHVTPNDAGGATAWGVTLAVYTGWLRAHGYKNAVTPGMLQHASTVELSAIYRAWYWNAVKASDLPKGVDLMVFDAAVLEGPHMAVTQLQSAVAVAADGVIGPVTLMAVASLDGDALCRALATKAEYYYRSLDDFALFGNGWLERNDRRLFAALNARIGV